MSIRPSRRRLLQAGIASGAAAPIHAIAAAGDLRVTDPRAANLVNPLGTHDRAIRLSWRLESPARGTVQTACRIEVASTPERLAAGRADLWDSGRIAGGKAFDIPYGGRPLASRQRAWWRVTAWDNHGRSATGPMAFWEMGLLDPADWTAPWIAAETRVDRGDREAGLPWVSAEAPAKGKSRAFRLRFTLDQDAELTVITMASGHYDLAVDEAILDLPPRSPLGWGPAPAATSTIAVRAGAHALTLSVGDAVWAPDFLGGKAGCAVLVRARKTDGSFQRFTTEGMRTSAATPAGWRSAPFDDGQWPVADAAASSNLRLPGHGAYLLRRDFSLAAAPVSARLYVTALGAHETRINGRPLDDSTLTPEVTDFRKRVLYRAYDVTALLKAGANAIGALVGDGWYGSYTSPQGRYAFGNPPLRYLAQLEVRHADGRVDRVLDQGGWRLSRAPVTRSEIYDGEDYDARLEPSGWTLPGFKAESAGWEDAGEAPPAEGALQGMVSPPIRRTDLLAPRAVTAVGAAWVTDFGQNFAGRVRLQVKGAAGDRVVLRFAERLRPDGAVDQSNLRAARASDSYVLRGDPDGETFEPHFTSHGFRYVEITGLKAAPKPKDVTGVVLHSDLAQTGRLHIGHAVIQQSWQNSLWSQRSNFLGIPTDCPQRDERLGWMGDANVFWDAAAFNMDVASFTRQWIADVRDAQTEAGIFTDVSPNTLGDPAGRGASPGWADAGVMLPWTAWQRYGDTAIIDDHWAAMARYLGYIAANNPGFVWARKRGNDYADWLAYDARRPGDPTTPKDLVGTAMWKRSSDAMADMARATGRHDEAARYEQMSRDIRRAFAAAFVSADGAVGNGSQTGYILALKFGLVPDGLRGAAAEKLKADIVSRGFLTTGFLGTPFSLDVLADAGFGGTVYDLLLRTAYPSWGYMVAHGATTTWERWNGDTGDVSMNSFNHYALGAVNGFVYRRIAGIAPVEPGFRVFRVNPLLDPRVTYGGGDYESVAGRISTSWRTDGGGFRLALAVPPNSQALVHLPAAEAGRVHEGGKRLRDRPEIAIHGVSEGRVVLAAGSGRYDFSVA